MAEEQTVVTTAIDCTDCGAKTGQLCKGKPEERSDPLSRPCSVCRAGIDQYCVKVKTDGTITTTRRPHHPERINPEASARKKKVIEASRNGVARVKALGTGGSWKSKRESQ